MTPDATAPAVGQRRAIEGSIEALVEWNRVARALIRPATGQTTGGSGT